MSLVNLVDLPCFGDSSGNLVAINLSQFIPFEVKRIYYIFNTFNKSRGFHAHIDLKQIAVCISGSCRFILDDGLSKEEVILSSPTKGLMITNMIWREMHDFSKDCVLLVLASKDFDEKDYIRDYNLFLREIDKAYIHPLSNVKSQKIGIKTKIWQFSVVLDNAQIGRGCNICAHTFIENDVVIGNNVTVKSGVYLWDGIRIEDDVFIEPCAVFSNDKKSDIKQYVDGFTHTLIEKGARIGANATILRGIKVGKNALIGVGAVVINDVPENAIMEGNPAYIKGYVNK